VLRQHRAAERVDLDLPDAPEPGAFKAEVDSADASEEAQEGQAHRILVSASISPSAASASSIATLFAASPTAAAG
jgi:hypothetical protein